MDIKNRLLFLLLLLFSNQSLSATSCVTMCKVWGDYSACQRALSGELECSPRSDIQKDKKAGATDSLDSGISPSSECAIFDIVQVQQLNIRDRPRKPSRIIGKANRGDHVCIYEFEGKWGRTERGWISRKYLSLDFARSNTLLSDIDYDGKSERLEWHCFSHCDGFYGLYQLKLYDDDGALLWSGPRTRDFHPLAASTGDGDYLPVLFEDIDGDGESELVFASIGSDPSVTTYHFFRWNGKGFVKKANSNRSLIWVDAGRGGNTLRWSDPDIDMKIRGSKTMWWALSLEKSAIDSLAIATMIKVRYPNYEIVSEPIKAKIRFRPGGATIVGWIK